MQPDEFTVYDYMSKMKNEGVKIEFTKAVRTMNNLLDTGAITSRKGIANGKQCNFYRFV
tara:strand:+ start:289 stop:465 length:177 start_codon:yes stop_codon:yes gene_type:complete